MSLQRINTHGALKSGQGYGASFGDYSLKVAYTEKFSKRTKPVHIMLVIDTSGSMSGGPIAAVLKAVESISRWLTLNQDSMSMWTFNSLVLNKLRPTGCKKIDFGRLRRDVENHIEGRTRLNDALYTVSKSWDPARMQDSANFMVFLTDGGENNSKFKKSQVQRELSSMASHFEKLIFLTAGSSGSEVKYLQELLNNVQKKKYVMRSAMSNGGNNIRDLFGFAQEVIEEVVVNYFHKGKEVASSKFVARGGGKQQDLAAAALQDLNTKMDQRSVLTYIFYLTLIFIALITLPPLLLLIVN